MAAATCNCHDPAPVAFIMKVIKLLLETHTRVHTMRQGSSLTTTSSHHLLVVAVPAQLYFILQLCCRHACTPLHVFVPAKCAHVALQCLLVQRLRELQAETPGKPVMLRVEVEGGGCSGFQYKFKLDDSKAQAEDL
jgi:hypothetical protein